MFESFASFYHNVDGLANIAATVLSWHYMVYVLSGNSPKPIETIELWFGGQTGVGRRNRVLDGDLCDVGSVATGDVATCYYNIVVNSIHRLACVGSVSPLCDYEIFKWL